MQNGNSYDEKLVEDPKVLLGYNMAHRAMELEKKNKTLQREMESKLDRKQVMIEEALERGNVEKKEHTQTREKVQSLEEDIAKARKEIEGHKEEIEKAKSHTESWRSKYTEERDNVANAWREVDSLQGKITSKESTINEMKSAGSQLRERYTASKDKIRDLRAENSNLNQSLTETKGRLSELEAFATGFSEVDEEHLLDGYAFLWEYARTEIYSQLETDLDNKVLRDRSAWEGLRNCSLVLQHHVPLPSSNSLVAKQMRVAIVLAILAREIDKYIFQPTYIAGEHCPSRPLLANLAAANTEKESFCRSILFSLDPESQSKSCQWRVRRTVQHVSSYVCALLSDEQNSQFCQCLENIVQKAVEIWHPIQHAKRKYESGFDPADSADESAAFVFPGLESVETPSVSGQAQNSLIIFPHIYAIEENKKILFTPTWLLSNMDPQWVAAEQEMGQDPPHLTLERAISTRLRKFIGRRSINNH